MQRRDFALSVLLSIPFILLLVLLGLIPLLFPALSLKEGKWFPVISNVTIEETQIFDVDDTIPGIYVLIDFDKVRSCELMPGGIVWIDEVGQRIPIVFDPFNETARGPINRNVGENQRSRIWKLVGVENINQVHAYTVHRCHPLWLTYTHIYP